MSDFDDNAAAGTSTITVEDEFVVIPTEDVAIESGDHIGPLDVVADPDDFLTVPPCPHPLRQPFRAIGWTLARLYGLVGLVMMLAVVAAVPIVNFYALGYLLDVEGRVARTGRLRDGFPLLALAGRFTSIAIGFWLFLLPVRLLSGAARDAALINPDSAATGRMEAIAGLVAVGVAIHLCLALSRGGSLSCFFRPIKNVRWLWSRWRERDYWDVAERNVARFVTALRIRYHFWLGLRGFAVAFAWLAIPSALLSVRMEQPGGMVAVSLIGSAMLAVVLSWVPFLQARFAAENRFGAGFELKTIRHAFRRAPLCWLLAMLVVYAFSLPLYLFKIAPLPSDAMAFATTVFLLSIWPSRIVTGWAYAQAMRRDEPAHWLWRWPSWLAMLPLLAFYVFLLFFTRYVVAAGRFDQFLHHAFLLPSPF